MESKKTTQDRYADQCNPNHPKDGPGRPHGYQGENQQHDLDNHANQKNKNNPKFLPKQ